MTIIKEKLILASFLYVSHEYLSWVNSVWIVSSNLNCLNWTSMVLLDHNSTTPVWSGCVLVSLSGSVSVLRSLGPGEVVLVAVIFSTWHSLPSAAPAIWKGFRNPNYGNWRKNQNFDVQLLKLLCSQYFKESLDLDIIVCTCTALNHKIVQIKKNWSKWEKFIT